MKLIPLTNGGNAIVDDCDYDLVSSRTWRRRTSGNTSYAISCGDGVFMHRLILCEKPDQLVDHKNHDGLDNRRRNIRVCTTAQNAYNKGKYKNNKSGYLGVCLEARKGRKPKYIAQISADNKQRKVGRFNSPVLAAMSYDFHARKLHKEFAVTNF